MEGNTLSENYFPKVALRISIHLYIIIIYIINNFCRKSDEFHGERVTWTVLSYSVTLAG